MIRFLIPLLVLGAPAAAQTTPLTDRPGRWVTVAPPAVETPANPNVSTELGAAAPPPTLAIEEPQSRILSPGPDTLRPTQRPIAPIEQGPDVALSLEPIETVPAPASRPISEVLADDATDLAYILEPDALDIAISPVAEVPLVDVAGPELFEPSEIAPDAIQLPLNVTASGFAAVVPPNVPIQPWAADAIATSFGVSQISGMSAVLLPNTGPTDRAWIQPVGLYFPAPDPAPQRSLPRPQGPDVLERISFFGSAPTAPRLAAVLVPRPHQAVDRVPALARIEPPRTDVFPFSALPPSALPEGPDALERIVIGPAPFPAQMAAVLIAAPALAVERLPLPSPSPRPLSETPFVSPELPPVLPAPDPQAIARLVEEAMFCWRLANLGAEARWAQVRVAVALDETNHASAVSIHLSGFSHVLSSAAEEAYRAAHNALTGCGAATQAEPATAHATLIFDRNGIRVR